MESNDMRGLIVPLPTPMGPDDDIDEASLASQVRRVLVAGAEGVWVNGTTAEFHALSTTQQQAAAQTVVEASKATGGVVVGQVGAAATRPTTENAEATAALGVDVLAAITPYYIPYSDAELMDHYRAIRAAVDLPLMIYHLPRMSKIELSVETVLSLAEEGTIEGIKESSGNIKYLRRLRERAEARGIPLAIFTGGGGLVSSCIANGGNGAMCAIANLIPGHISRLVAASLTSDWETAGSLQSAVYQLEDALGLPELPRWSPTVAIYKSVLCSIGVIEDRRCAPPLRALTSEQAVRLEERVQPLILRLEDESAMAGASK